jgi:hypothetical protein
VYYVGKTDRTLRQRLAEERQRFLDGREFIPNFASRFQGRREYHYRPLNSKLANVQDFQVRSSALEPIINEVLSTFQLFVATAPADPALVLRIESGLLWALWDAGGLHQPFLSNEASSWRKRPKTPLRFTMSMTGLISGLGETLDV